MNNSQFKNPYYDGDKSSDKSRIIYDVSQSDFMFIRLIRPGNSTLSGVSGHLWKKTVEALKIKGIDNAEHIEQFEQFIATSRLVTTTEYERLVAGGLLDGPIGGVVSATTSPNVRGRETPASDQHPTNAPVVSNVQSKGRTISPKRTKGQGVSETEVR